VFAVVCARLRMPLLWAALALLVGGALLGGPGWAGLAGLPSGWSASRSTAPPGSGVPANGRPFTVAVS
jgi:hypothetical protein